jgi:Rrf2 family protein
MKLTTRSEYGLLALIHLARHYGEGGISVRDIAAEQAIPAQFLEQLMLILKRAGYVRSTRGRSGGFRLARAPETISLAEIIRLFDGALAPTESVSRYFYEPTPVEREPALLGLFRELRNIVSDRLEATTLAMMTEKGTHPGPRSKRRQGHRPRNRTSRQ